MKLPSALTFPVVAMLMCSQNVASADQVDQVSTPPAVLKTYKIYHSLGSKDTFIPRGAIELTSPTTSSENQKETSKTIVASVQQEENCLVNAAEEIDSLVSSGNFYRIKIVDEETGQSVLASVPGCDFRRSNFRCVRPWLLCCCRIKEWYNRIWENLPSHH